MEKLEPIPDRSRSQAALEAERAEKPGHFAHVPLDRMDPERAIGNVGHAEVLSAGQQIFAPDRNHRPERDLEWPAPEIEVAGSADPGMKVDAVAASAHGIRE